MAKAKEHVKEWTTGGVTHVKIAATDKEAHKKMKDKGAVVEATYFSNTGVRTYTQYAFKKAKE